MSSIAFKGIENHIGGLCDRLKGMYSCYVLAKALNRDFHYILTHQEVLFAKQTPPKIQGKFHHIIDYQCFLNYKNKIEQLDFDPTINHIIQTNIDFTQHIPKLKIVEFSTFIRDVFDIDMFEKTHDVHKYSAGIHVRCGGSLVNWNDYNFGIESNKENIVNRVKNVCEHHESVYFCSDSSEILEKVADLNISNVVITPNTPVHVDRSPVVTENDTKNVFFDLLTLANCENIYFSLGEFAKTAARINNKPLIDLYNC